MTYISVVVVAGYRVVEELGIVSAGHVRSKSMLKDILAVKSCEVA